MSSTRTKIVIAVVISPFVLFGIGSALALEANTAPRIEAAQSNTSAMVDTSDAPSSVPGKSWADLGAEGLWVWTPITAVRLSSLPAGTQIVNCWGKIKQLPSGVRLQVGKNFAKENPNFHFLTDGRCAVSPNANSTSAQKVPKDYDLQWFGTGMAGTPGVGNSSCFSGDPLNNHCGVETNVRSHPAMMATSVPLPPKPSTR